MDTLSLQSERIECEELLDIHRAATPGVKEKIGLRLEQIGNTFISIASKENSILLNRVIGLGVEKPEHKETVKEIVKIYAQENIKRYFVHLHPESQPPELKNWLLEAGLKKGRGWQKFIRNDEKPQTVLSDLSVRRIDSKNAEDYGRIVCSCFDLSENCIPLIATFIDRPNWHVFMTFDGDTPAGSGSLFIKDNLGWFEFGSTLPEFRGKGSQRILLTKRIEHCIDMGCKVMFTETGEAVEGDPQHSYKNILRTGFKPFCLRENYEPES